MVETRCWDDPGLGVLMVALVNWEEVEKWENDIW
jgi:hypothetical protein